MVCRSEKRTKEWKWTNMLCTSMRKAGEWRTLQIGSPKRSVKRESFPLGPTSHLLSTSSTPTPSLLGSNSLTTIILSSPISILSKQIHRRQTTSNRWVSSVPGGDEGLLYIYRDRRLRVKNNNNNVWKKQGRRNRG